MVSLFEDKKRGIKEEEAVKEMVKDIRGKLKWLFHLIEEGEKEGVSLEEVKNVLKLFKVNEVVSSRPQKLHHRLS